MLWVEARPQESNPGQWINSVYSQQWHIERRELHASFIPLRIGNSSRHI